MGRTKKILAVTVLMIAVLFTSCGVIKKVEEQTKYTEEKKADKAKVSKMVFETKSISEIRADAEKSMSVLGTDSSGYGNIRKTDIVPIITEKDEIYNIKLEKLDGNELSKGSQQYANDKITSSYTVYRNDKEKVKKKLNISGGTDVESLIGFVENYMDTTYKDSLFKWVVEYIDVRTSADKKETILVSIRPSYDGVVFTRTLVVHDGKVTNIASDLRKGLLVITEMNKIDEYYSISPYYEVEKQGEAISEILSIESVLSIVANKLDKDTGNEIKLFELAYRLNKDLSAVPIWNIVVSQDGNDRNFQIDAVTGDVYFE